MHENQDHGDTPVLTFFDQGKEAFDSEDYDEATKLLTYSAVNKDLDSQALLGELEIAINGNYEDGLNWLSLAARQGHAEAFDSLYNAFSPEAPGLISRILFFVDPVNQSVDAVVHFGPFDTSERKNKQLISIEDAEWKNKYLLHDVFELNWEKDELNGETDADDSDYEWSTTTAEKLFDRGVLTVEKLKQLSDPLITPEEWFSEFSRKYYARELDVEPITLEDLGITIPATETNLSVKQTPEHIQALVEMAVSGDNNAAISAGRYFESQDDLVNAALWFRHAVVRGSVDAAVYLARIYGLQKNHKAELHYLEFAALHDHAEASLLLAEHYTDENEILRAAFWARRALALGHPDAPSLLKYLKNEYPNQYPNF